MNIRETAYQCLYKVLEEGAFLNDVVDGTLDKYAYLEKSDRHFLVRLLKGTVEKKLEIDYYLSKNSKTPVKKMKKEVRTILRMSIYQIHFMDSAKDHAVVNEAVKLAGKHGYPGFKGFVNGVLRNYIRREEELAQGLAESYLEIEHKIGRLDASDDAEETEKRSGNEKENIAAEELGILEARFSVPAWIIERFIEDLGWENAIKTLRSFNEPSALTIRLNTLKASEQEIVKRLEDEGLTLERMDFPMPSLVRQNTSSDSKIPVQCQEYLNVINSVDCPAVYRLSGVDSLSGLKSFKEGLFYIQDLSSMLPPVWAGIGEGMQVVDVCAAPGGKTMIAATLAKESGHVVSRDKDQKKADLIKENIEKMGLNNVEVQVKDATVADADVACDVTNADETKSHSSSKSDTANNDGPFDVCIADLPCSGLGVIGRKSDLRYRVKPEDLDQLADLQRKIIDASVGLVKKGGILSYSTCTLDKKENEENRDYILEKYPEYQLLHDETILPHMYGSDGFYIAIFRKHR